MASIATRQINTVQPTFTDYPIIDIGEEFRIDTKPFINRPFFLESTEWKDTFTRYSILPLSYNKLPRDIINSNESLRNAVKLGAYFRSDLTINFSVAGTIVHSGCILVGILPPLTQVYSGGDFKRIVNSLMTGPHGFLNANEATSLSLHVPWFCNSDLGSLDTSPTTGTFGTVTPGVDISKDNANFGTIVMLIMNPLTPSDGASKTLNIISEAIFNSLDILVPSPRYIKYSQSQILKIANGIADAGVSFVKDTIGDAIDGMRTGMFSFLGLHNPNFSQMSDKIVVSPRNYLNVNDSRQYFEKLDPSTNVDRIMQGPDFNTLQDEMDMLHVIGKPQFIDRITVKEVDPVGTFLWSRPISPKQSTSLSPNYYLFANNIQLLHLLSRGWRGSINIHIQSVMNNKQQVKLRLLQLYNPSFEITNGYPTYKDILNAPSHLMEFTAGGQIQTINLPYLCRNKITPCMRDNSSEAMFHGIYYLYVAQPLANSGGSPIDVEFNIFYSLGDDFKFYGYATEAAQMFSIFDTLPKEVKSLKVMKAQSLDVMNEPQNQSVLDVNTSMEDASEAYSDRLLPYKNIREIIRRAYKQRNFQTNIVSGQAFYTLPLAEFGGEVLASTASNPIMLTAGMYYGKHIGFKMRMKIDKAVNMLVKYVPQNCFVDVSTLTVRACTVAPADIDYQTVDGSGHPVTFIDLPIFQTREHTGELQYNYFEFVVPNTTFYKYVGGPGKLTGQYSNLSIADMGTLLFLFTSAKDDTVNATVYYGLTDESRFGFHTIAPLIYPLQENDKLATLYVGDINDPNSLPSVGFNPYLYYTRQ